MCAVFLKQMGNGETRLVLADSEDKPKRLTLMLLHKEGLDIYQIALKLSTKPVELCLSASSWVADVQT